MIAEGEWPEIDFREAVLLEESPICHRQAAGQPAAAARIVSYENTKVVIEAKAPQGGGWVVLNDVWHPIGSLKSMARRPHCCAPMCCSARWPFPRAGMK